MRMTLRFRDSTTQRFLSGPVTIACGHEPSVGRTNSVIGPSAPEVGVSPLAKYEQTTSKPIKRIKENIFGTPAQNSASVSAHPLHTWAEQTAGRQHVKKPPDRTATPGHRFVTVVDCTARVLRPRRSEEHTSEL